MRTVLAYLFFFSGLVSMASAAPRINGYEPAWWKQAVVYQVYPRSFSDTNGDGIGDLAGVTSKLDYLQTLGVDVIWLSPHYDSPNADNGYDIRDYEKVMAEFGTMADFDHMLAQLKRRKMRLIIDLVVNHSSDEHRWFQASRSSRTSPFRDYYIWRDGKPNAAAPHGFDPPNNWRSFFSGSAWEFDQPSKQFYLHLFAKKQPDLNWDNARVRKEVYGLMRFWLDKGVDGFRMDVITLISKPAGLPDLTAAQLDNPSATFAMGPHRDEYLQEMNNEVLSHYDLMTVGEADGITLKDQTPLVDDRRHELGMVFNFDAVRLDRDVHRKWRDWTLQELKAVFDKHARELDKHVWDTVFLSNHDNPRMVSSFGDDSTPELRVRSAKLLETLVLTQRGTPFLYQGDELGMTNYPFRTIADFDDIEVKNAYAAQVKTGKVPEAAFLADLRRTSRDNARTPMQWSAAAHAGFSTGTPWLAVNPAYTTINAAQETADPKSVYRFTQALVALRHAHPAFVYGDYADLAPTDAHLYAYTRTLGRERWLVVLNFGAARAYTVPYEDPTLVLGNVDDPKAELAAWEARVYRLSTGAAK